MTENKGRHHASAGDTSKTREPADSESSKQSSQKGFTLKSRFQGKGEEPGSFDDTHDTSHARQYKAKKRTADSDSYVAYDMDDVLKKKKPVRSIILGVALVILLGLLIFGGFRLIQSFGFLGSSTQPGQDVSVFIPEGASTTEIAKALKGQGVISSETKFIADVKSRGVDQQLQPGQYNMKTGMSDSDTIDALVLGPQVSAGGNKLTIPEGLTIEQTAQVVEKSCGIPAQDFIDEAHHADKYVADYPFLADVYDNSLEGFLFPKTYMIPPGSDAEYVIRVMLDQFVKETADLDMSYAQSKNLTLFDVVTIASMIEKETANVDEKPLVASVIYNRLHEGWKLQICSTVIYAMGYDNYDGHPLLDSDLEIDSPYNTYMYDSLPAGPICSPQLNSLVAAAHPAQTDYFYYVLTSKDGTHTFCATDDEFAAATEKYHELFNIPN